MLELQVEYGIINTPFYEWHFLPEPIYDFETAYEAFKEISLPEKYKLFRKQHPEQNAAIASKCVFVKQIEDDINVSFSMVARLNYDYEDWLDD